MSFSQDAPKCVILVGPTSSGKTEISIRLAELFQTEIVSLDASQVYKDIPILTGAPKKEQLSRVKHHLVGVFSPNFVIQAAQVSDYALELVKTIHQSGRLPIVVAGSYMYLKFFLHGYSFDRSSQNSIRTEIEPNYELLRELDPEYAKVVHPNDSVRIRRALAYIFANGQRFSQACSDHSFASFRVKPLMIALWWPRTDLYRRIEERCRSMIDEGLIDEVKNVVSIYGEDPFGAVKSIGFKQFRDYLKGRVSFDEAFKSFVKQTKRFARQQSYYARLEPKKRGFQVLPESGLAGFRTVELLVGRSKILTMDCDFEQLVSVIKDFKFDKPTILNLSAKSVL